MFRMFHHKSYCTLFTSRGQPRIVFQVLYLYNTPQNWLQWRESNPRPPGYEPGQIPLLTHCVNIYHCKTHCRGVPTDVFQTILPSLPTYTCWIQVEPRGWCMQYVLQWCPGLRLHPKPTTPRALLQALRACFLSTSTATLAVSLSVVSIAVFMVRQ